MLQGPLSGVLYSACRKMVILHVAPFKVVIYLTKIGFLDKMVQFECRRSIRVLVSLNFGVHCGVSISMHARKWECCMWLLNKVIIHFTKIGFLDTWWSNLNTTGPYTMVSLNSWGPHCGVLFYACRKMEMLHVISSALCKCHSTST